MESCPRCRGFLPPETLNQGGYLPCPHCDTEVDVEVFPAFFRAASEPETPETGFVEGTSTCFYHAENKAAVVCQGCGRFLCSLCRIDLPGRRLCPRCLEKGEEKGTVDVFERQRFRYDNLALALAVLPVIFLFAWFFTLITAPAALFVAVRYWRAPGSLVSGLSKMRLSIAACLAGLQIAGWVFLISAGVLY